MCVSDAHLAPCDHATRRVEGHDAQLDDARELELTRTPPVPCRLTKLTSAMSDAVLILVDPPVRLNVDGEDGDGRRRRAAQRRRGRRSRRLGASRRLGRLLAARLLARAPPLAARR